VTDVVHDLRVVPMTAQEAEEVIRFVKDENYPPTNPAVLLRAAAWAWQEYRIPDMIKVLAWMLIIIRRDHEELPANTREAIWLLLISDL
jgi:hypothetical protein